jgi:hypothetical protein
MERKKSADERNRDSWRSEPLALTMRKNFWEEIKGDETKK